MTRDSASPILWNLYLSDFNLPDHSDDVVWEDTHVSILAQVDDLLMFGASPVGMQAKLDSLVHWSVLETTEEFMHKPRSMMVTFSRRE